MSQYIGARYVPKFMGTYDATQAYENMCVVDNGLGTSYISKVPTPAGTPLTNTDFWAIYGASSGAIINLQNQIGDLNDLTTTDNSDLVHAINEVDVVAKTINRQINGKVLLIGDSIGTIQNGDGKTFYELFLARIGKTLNTDGFIVSISSRGFTTSYPTKGNFKIIFDEFWTDNPAEDPDDYSAIIVTGGANDISSTVSAIETAVSSFVADVKSTCKNATVYIGVNSRNQVNYNGVEKFRTVCLPGYKTCEKYGAVFLHGLEYALFNSLYQSDKLHPNANGVNLLAGVLYESFTTGCGHVITELINDISNITLSADVAAITNMSMLSEYQQDDVISIAPNGFSSVEITLTNPDASVAALTLGTLDNNIWYSTTNKGLAILYPPIRITHNDDTTEDVFDGVLYKTNNAYVLAFVSGHTHVKKITLRRPDTVTRSAIYCS